MYHKSVGPKQNLTLFKLNWLISHRTINKKNDRRYFNFISFWAKMAVNFWSYTIERSGFFSLTMIRHLFSRAYSDRTKATKF